MPIGDEVAMKNKSYVIKRDDVYIGKVIKIDDEKDFLAPDGCVDVFTLRGDKISINENYSHKELRSMLFVPLDGCVALANDLLYRDTDYPILNITDKDYCLEYASNNGGYVIDQAYNISKLLEIFDYPSWLTYKDIVDIRKNFFSGTFAKDHCVLFGYKEEIDGTYTYVGGGSLPKEMFDLLDHMGNNSLLDVIFEGAKKNVFRPFEEEGPIKKLSIF